MKTKLFIVALGLFTLPFVQGAAPVVPVPPAPVWGVVTSMIQLPPAADYALFVSTVGDSLRQGVVPNGSVFTQLESCYDMENYGAFYPDVLRQAVKYYTGSVNAYLTEMNRRGVTAAKLESVNNYSRSVITAMETKLAAVDKASVETRHAKELAFSKAFTAATALKAAAPMTYFSAILPGPSEAFKLSDTSKQQLSAKLNSLFSQVPPGGVLPAATWEWHTIFQAYLQAEHNDTNMKNTFNPNAFSITVLRPQ